MKYIYQIIIVVAICSFALPATAQELTAKDIQLPSVARQLEILDEAVQFKPEMFRDKEKTAKSYKRTYPWAKLAIESGHYDDNPKFLLFWAGYAKHHGDSVFADYAYNKVKSPHLTVSGLNTFMRSNKGYLEKRSDLLTFIVERNYTYREKGFEPFTPDSGAIYRRETLQSLAEDFAPGLKPLIEITYRTDTINDFPLYREAVDSLVAGSLVVSPLVQESIVVDFLRKGFLNEQFSTLVDYSSKQPLTTIIDNNALANVLLCYSSLKQGDAAQSDAYLRRTKELDSDLAQAFWDSLSETPYNSLIKNPNDEEMQKHFLETTDRPIEVAYSLFNDIMAKHFPYDVKQCLFKWRDVSDYSPEELEVV